ncbi:MAG: tetratricopeptide repeat protein [Holophagaceae bacterium]
MNPHHLKLLKKAQALERGGRALEAAAAYKVFLCREPKHTDAWSDYAGQLILLGRLDEAQSACEAALALDQGHPSARINLGVILMRRDQLDGCERHLRQVLEAAPDRLDAQLFLAECLLNKKNPEGAELVLKAIPPGGARDGAYALLKRRHAELWTILGLAFLEVQKFSRAEEACRAALRIEPSNLMAQANLGSIQMAQGHLVEAERLFQLHLSEHPTDENARLLLITCLARKGDLALMDQEIEKVLQQEPTNFVVHKSLSGTYYTLGRWDAYRAEITRFRAVDPASAYLDYEQSFVDLLFGDMRQGWQHFEARLKIPKELRLKKRSFQQPAWQGEPFEGKTILLWAEQGLGDTLMFLRYVPLVKALGGRVIVEAQPPLMDVAATCPGADIIIPKGAPWVPFDLQASLMSLPCLFGTELATVPAEVPYLGVPENVPHGPALQECLDRAGERTRIGLVWAGSPGHGRDFERSLPVAFLEPLASLPGVAWFSFQVGNQDVPPLPDLTVLTPLLGDFSDTAFALNAMDLLITVDTSVAHLAGAMGIPTLLLLSYQPDYRWMLERTDSPWYPTMRLYRQPAYGDWGSVIRQVIEDLTQDS